nr:probable metal-nicotianamine transporter YSL7 [Ipomoea batatas]
MGVQRRVRRLAGKVSLVTSVGFLDSLMSFIFCSEVGRWSTLFPGGGDRLHSHHPSSVLDLGYRLGSWNSSRYIKDRLKSLRREHLQAQEELKRIQSVPLGASQTLCFCDESSECVEKIFESKEVPSWWNQLTFRAFCVIFVLGNLFTFIVMKLNLTTGISLLSMSLLLAGLLLCQDLNKVP